MYKIDKLEKNIYIYISTRTLIVFFTSPISLIMSEHFGASSLGGLEGRTCCSPATQVF